MTLTDFLKSKKYNDIISEFEKEYTTITNPQTLVTLKDKQIMRAKKSRQEHLIVVTLDAASKKIKTHLISKGLVNFSLVHAREVFYPAIIDNAIAIILLHNHPSGSLAPSLEDEEITRKMKVSGEILGIRVLDHVIISKDGHYSFRSSGKI